VKSKYWTCPNANSQKTAPRKKKITSTSPDRGNFFRLDGHPCSVLNVMPKLKEWVWRAHQFHEKIKSLNQSKWQESKDSSSENENHSTSPDRGNFFRLDGQPCSVLNVVTKVKERPWRAVFARRTNLVCIALADSCFGKLAFSRAVTSEVCGVVTEGSLHAYVELG